VLAGGQLVVAQFQGARRADASAVEVEFAPDRVAIRRDMNRAVIRRRRRQNADAVLAGLIELES
jgi:hypothetical protein